MAGAGKEGFVADGRRKRQGDEQCDLQIFAGCEFSQVAKFRDLENF